MNLIMTHKLAILKTDLYNVFVKGNANSIQLARVFVALAIPVLVISMIAYIH
jgi:hypothetical protein